MAIQNSHKYTIPSLFISMIYLSLIPKILEPDFFSSGPEAELFKITFS